MFYNELQKVEVSEMSNGGALNNVSRSISQIKNNQSKCHILSVYLKMNNIDTESSRGGYKTITPHFHYLPIDKIKIEEDKRNIIKLDYQDNYYEEIKSVYLESYNKVYTMNKGFISCFNLRNTDVLYTSEGRIAKIIKISESMITGKFFKMDLKYGNNFMVNGMVVLHNS